MGNEESLSAVLYHDLERVQPGIEFQIIKGENTDCWITIEADRVVLRNVKNRRVTASMTIPEFVAVLRDAGIPD